MLLKDRTFKYCMKWLALGFKPSQLTFGAILSRGKQSAQK